METTIVHWGYMRIMEKKMETTMVIGLRAKGFRLRSLEFRV